MPSLIFSKNYNKKLESCLLQICLALLPLSCRTQTCPAFANSVDPDQLAAEEANRSGSELYVIKYVILQQQSGSSNLIGWKLEVEVAIKFIQQNKG